MQAAGGTAGLIVAAGRGLRLGAAIPKQYLPLGPASDPEPVLTRTLRALLAHPAIDLLQVVIGAGDEGLYDAAVAPLADPRLLPPVTGGATRAASVRAGLDALAPHAPALVLVHDAARPFLDAAVVDRVLAALTEAPAACPGLPLADALWREQDGLAATPVDRAGLWRAQTPQGFRFDAIRAAHATGSEDALDDVAVARAAGLPVRLVLGDPANFKITTAADLDRARQRVGGLTHPTTTGALAAEQGPSMDIRTGNGFDVHAFAEGDHVTLCGVKIPHPLTLSGHSDADVGMHALTDAIFGALAEGDIGQWFPPSDPQWKGADSRIFLEKAMERARARGFAVTHLDCTLICEAPKIGPHAAAMRAALAAITGLEVERISVKATTTERLGFPGRGEGVAALATATLVRA
jgi:2-C-methyl-D-erythritol 4-phosphate cytidylyltransferase/2-C-methyl-D-erythritol 2,4-cyclodiphosphate synthase